MSRPHPLPRLLSLLCVAAAPGVAAAQDGTTTITPASVEACGLITVDAQRLACYDTAIKRVAPSTAQADAAASIAKEQKDLDASSAKAKRRGGSMYADDDYDAVLANAGKGSLLDSRWELAAASKLGVFQMRAYKPVYLLPAFWTSKKNEMPSSPNPDNTVTVAQDLQSIETKFQLSFKTKFVENLFGDNGDIWGGYTQSSRWQTYNSEASRPFRETNYEPEVMMVFRTNYALGDWHGRLAGLSLNHQSNGRGDPLSRSWNRVIGMIGFDRDNWALVVRPWYRIPEGHDDDNPDIENYMGRGDATLTYSHDGHEFSLMGRHSLRGGDQSHGALQASWGFPIDRNLRGHIEIFHGYGESLIDYNHKATYIGLGISLLEWY
ncbi:phospholipase A [Pseudoxanthomonas winnipegensis]|uniref:Phospholipase A1 n=1 Tax=Pseudoxanthomonas winnipegensis TaxID=2480810 RepID=A0A4V2HGF4_9GAMM|nr:phospholipase A [Pseudoxanthomonas winnipegensis]TAA46436.1 phospholipase [Pseudoxanthomonas winnipegensis]